MKKLLLCLALAVGGLTLFASTNTAEAHGGPGYGYRGGYRGPVGFRANNWNGYGYRGNFYRGGSCGYTPYPGCYGNSCYGSGLYLSTPNFGFSTYGW